jgi:hypothetical protein
VLGILNDLEQAIRANDIPQINQLLQQLGKTAIINKTKPTPLDEAREPELGIWNTSFIRLFGNHS